METRLKRRLRLKPVVVQVAAIAVVLALDALVATYLWPGIMRVHQWLTIPGVTVVRVLRGYNPFVQNAPSWFEMLVNGAIYCTVAAALAVVLQTRRKWCNALRLIYVTVLALSLAVWLVPHNPVKFYGGEGEGIALDGKGHVILAFTEKLAPNTKRDRRSSFAKTYEVPGVFYFSRVGMDVRGDLVEVAEQVTGSKQARRQVLEHRYVIDMWMFLLVTLLFPLADLWDSARRRRRIVSCPQCLYNLTGIGGSLCPGCGLDLRCPPSDPASPPVAGR